MHLCNSIFIEVMIYYPISVSVSRCLVKLTGIIIQAEEHFESKFVTGKVIVPNICVSHNKCTSIVACCSVWKLVSTTE